MFLFLLLVPFRCVCKSIRSPDWSRTQADEGDSKWGNSSVCVSRLVHAINSNKQISGFNTESENESPIIFVEHVVVTLPYQPALLLDFHMFAQQRSFAFKVLLWLVRVRRWQRVCTPTTALLFIAIGLSYWTALIERSFSYRVNGKFLWSRTPRKIPPRMSHFAFPSFSQRAARQTPSERHENHNPHTPKSLNKLFTWFSVHAFRMASNVIFSRFRHTTRLCAFNFCGSYWKKIERLKTFFSLCEKHSIRSVLWKS